MNATAYVTYSNKTQSIDCQISDIQSYCKREDINLVKIFEETESDNIKIRPELSKMENYIEKNQTNIDYVIVSELSRLGRTSKILETIENLNSKKIGLISLKENLTSLNKDKTVNHISSFIINVLASINEFETDTTKYRLKSEIEKGVRKGHANGGKYLPYGYKKINKMLVKEDDDESYIVQQIFDLYLKGNGTPEICNILNKVSVPTRSGKKWVDGVIYGILTNPIYIGQRRRKKSEEIIEGRKTTKKEYELIYQEQLKIIEPEVFEKVQKLLKSNYNKSNKHNNYTRLLNPQKIICGKCLKNGKTHNGKIHHYFPHQRKTEKEKAYKCISKRYGENCKNVSVGIDKIEDFLKRVILYMFPNKLFENYDFTKTKNDIKDLEKKLEIENNKLIEARQLHSKYVERWVKGRIDDQIYNQMINVCKMNEKRISDLIRIFNNQLKKLNDSLNSIDEIKFGIEEYLNGVDMPSNIVNKIVEKIIVNEDDNYHNYFPVKNDKAIIMNVEIAGGKEFNFLLSRYSHKIYFLIDLNNPTGFEIPKIEDFTVINKNVAISGVEGAYPEIPNDFKFDFFEIE